MLFPFRIQNPHLLKFHLNKVAAGYLLPKPEILDTSLSFISTSTCHHIPLIPIPTSLESIDIFPFPQLLLQFDYKNSIIWCFQHTKCCKKSSSCIRSFNVHSYSSYVLLLLLLVVPFYSQGIWSLEIINNLSKLYVLELSLNPYLSNARTLGLNHYVTIETLISIVSLSSTLPFNSSLHIMLRF
jgi:hypothetical protein